MLNFYLKRGNGDDGFFPIGWAPSTIDVAEYQELRRAFDAHAARRKARRSR
jgi:hypothetical protein